MFDYCRRLFILCAGVENDLGESVLFLHTQCSGIQLGLSGLAVNALPTEPPHQARKKLPYNKIGAEYQFGARVYLDPLSGFELLLPRD